MVLSAAILHAGWNAVVKAGEDRPLTIIIIMVVGTILAAPALPFVPLPNVETWGYVILSTLIHLGYFFFLIQGYQHGDLSKVYPVARGAAPLMVAGGAALFAGEMLPPAALVGLVLASASIASLAFERDGDGFRDLKPLVYGFLTAIFIASYSVVDGLGVRAAPTQLSYILWLYVLDGIPLILFALVFRKGRIRPYLARHWRSLMTAGVMVACAYGLVIWAMSLGALAVVSALRETSVIFAALIGTLFLGESFGRWRIAAAVVMAGGILLMQMSL